jgi:deazaflavin-dependent oxidoreductase (nitroreductase family)
MTLPAGLARFNRRLTNRFVAPFAGRRGFVDRLDHVGRISGRRYSTPIKAFLRGDDDRAYIVLSYGRNTDWAGNVLRGPASLLHRGRARPVVAAAIVPTTDPSPQLALPIRIALQAMRVTELLRLELGPSHKVQGSA